MGEDLPLWRDTDGKIALTGAFCPHRQAPLVFGRNENCGLRCIYHGWKFDADGNCVDIPNTDDGGRIKDRVKLSAYSVREHGGLLFAFMGPKKDMPPLPFLPWQDLPSRARPTQTRVTTAISKLASGGSLAKFIFKKLSASSKSMREGYYFLPVRCEHQGNYLNHLENLADESHVGFLHGAVTGTTSTGGLLEGAAFIEKAPDVCSVKETKVGMIAGFSRENEDGSTNVRANAFQLPFTMDVCNPPPFKFGTWQVAVPIDDEKTMFFSSSICFR